MFVSLASEENNDTPELNEHHFGFIQLFCPSLNTTFGDTSDNWLEMQVNRKRLVRHDVLH